MLLSVLNEVHESQVQSALCYRGCVRLWVQHLLLKQAKEVVFDWVDGVYLVL